MSEVFYFNSRNDLQKLELYNISSSDFVKRSLVSGFRFLCIVEDGDIKITSPEFKVIEQDIFGSLSGLLVS